MKKLILIFIIAISYSNISSADPNVKK